MGERQVANLLIDLGFAGSRRTAQCRGTTDSSDVESQDLKHLYIEVKYGESYQLGNKKLLDEWEVTRRNCGWKEPVMFVKPGRSRVWWIAFRMGPTTEPMWTTEHAFKDILPLLDAAGKARKPIS